MVLGVPSPFRPKESCDAKAVSKLLVPRTNIIFCRYWLGWWLADPDPDPGRMKCYCIRRNRSTVRGPFFPLLEAGPRPFMESGSDDHIPFLQVSRRR